MNAPRGAADEGLRYFAASALALTVDFSTYVGLIRLGQVHYLAANYEIAKLLSAGIGFCFNFASRKLLLFTRY